MQAVCSSRIAPGTFGLFGKFSHHESVGISFHASAYLIQDGKIGFEIAVVAVKLQVGRVRPVPGRSVALRYRPIVRKCGIVKKCIGDIEPKTVDATCEPVVEHRKRGLARLWIAPVEFRLLAKEFVMVI